MGSKSMYEIIELLKNNDITLFVKEDQLGIKSKKTNKISENLLTTIKSNKKELITFLNEEKKNSGSRVKTAGDFGLPTSITNKKLWEFLKLPIHKNRISNIYPLTPLQKGFLFHNLYSNNASSYISQFHCDLKGIISKESFDKSWEHLMQNILS